MAETTLGAAIALRRNIVYYDRYVKSGAYPGQLARLFQQSAVSGVEGPHCGDENHMVMFAVVLEEGSPQLGLGGKCLHAPKVAP